MNAAADGGHEQPVLEDREVEHRRAPTRPSITTKQRQTARRPRSARRSRPGCSSPRDRPSRAPSTNPVSPNRNVSCRARRSCGPRSSLSARAGSYHAHALPNQRQRDVEPEHPVPADRDQRPAEHRADHEPNRGDHRVGPHRQPELLARERVGDDRGRVREQERAAHALQDPPHDQLVPPPANPAPSDATPNARNPPM